MLYASLSLDGAFAETLLRAPTDRDVLWSEVLRRRQAAFQVTKRLRLVKLHGEGLAWFGVTAADIAESDYALTQKIASLAHGSNAADGIQYRSRFDNDELCIALFDRADAKLDLISEGAPIDRTWTRGVLDSHGYHLIDL